MGKIPHFYLDYHPIALNLKFHGTYRFIGLSHILCGGKVNVGDLFSFGLIYAQGF
jgi:hypothetical protein